jgi:hypothetical protein
MTRCRAHSKQTGLQCRQPVTPGREVCRYHGGHQARGIASVHWRGRGYSKDLPTRLADRWRQAAADPALLELTSEVALVDARLGELLATLPATAADTDAATWADLLALIEQRRRLVDSERRREEALQVSMTMAQALAFAGALQTAVVEIVTDPQQRAALALRVERLLARPAPRVVTADG